MGYPFQESGCGISLKDGSLSVAFGFLVGTFIGVIAFVAYLKGRVQDYYMTSGESFVLYLDIVILLMLALMDALLIYGIYRKNLTISLVWLAVHCANTVYVLLRFVVDLYRAVSTVELLYATGVLLFYVTLLAALVYGLLVVSSYAWALSHGRDPEQTLAPAPCHSPPAAEQQRLTQQSQQSRWSSYLDEDGEPRQNSYLDEDGRPRQSYLDKDRRPRQTGYQDSRYQSSRQSNYDWE